MTSEDQLRRLLSLAQRLDEAHIHHKLSQFRDDAIAIEVAVPGERWEIEFTSGGEIEVERFRSDGVIGGEDLLEELFRNFSD